MVLILLLLLCSNDNLIIKLHQKNSYHDEECLFIGCFKVESVQRMTNKEALVHFIYKPT